MSVYEISFLIFVFVVLVVRYYLRVNKPKEQRKELIKERLMKILYNPLTEKWMWTKFNPQTRTWEWLEEATAAEVEKYQDVVFPELQGMKVLSYHDRTYTEDNING